MKQQEIAFALVMYCDARNWLLPQFQTNMTIVAIYHNGLNLVYKISSHGFIVGESMGLCQ